MNLRGAYVLNLIFYILLPKDNFWRVAGEYKKQKKRPFDHPFLFGEIYSELIDCPLLDASSSKSTTSNHIY